MFNTPVSVAAGHPAETNLAWVHALLRRAAEHHANAAAAPAPSAADEGSAAHWYGVARRPIPPGTVAVEDEWRAGLQNLGAENGFRGFRTGCLVLVENIQYLHTPF